MGAACCVAAKDRTIVSGPSGETLQRHVRYSPSWSFRHNRGRVAGEETHESWRGGGNSQVEAKSGTAVEISFSSEEDSTLNNLSSFGQKRPLIESAGVWRLQISDDAMSRNLVEAKGLPQSPPVSHPSPVKLSPSGPSLSTSPQSSQSHLLPPNSTPSRCHRHSPRHQLYKAPTFSVPGKASYESTRGANGGSSDSWSIPIFSELTTTRRQRWSFDSENSGFSLEKISNNGRNSGSPTDLPTCSVCTHLLTERSSWESTSQKIVSATELTIVSVLSCGHVYHAECLEYLTPEINKYDPTCPVCALGEKQTVKIRPEKASKAKMVAKAKKRFSKHEADSSQKSNIRLDHHRSGGVKEETGPKISSGKPFLKRHFSFSSKAGKSSPENHSAHIKGFFWSRSSKG